MINPNISTTAVLNDDGTRLEGAVIEVFPALLNLAPGQKQSVTVHIPLVADLYQAERTYTSAIAIIGMGNGRDQLVSVKVEVH
jgi:hypothetical protein